MAITEKQKLAIECDKGNVLVSASAGSGKTFVMLERVKRLLLEKKANIDEILCVTFTVAAAREMKEKLATKLTDSIKDGKDSSLIEKQLELLPTANISTMHAFCKNLLTEFFYEAGLDPAFSILDDRQSKVLANRAIDRLFEDLYEEKSPLLDEVLPYYFKKRSDKILKKDIIDIYQIIISEADPMAVLNNGRKYYKWESIDELTKQIVNDFKFQFANCEETVEKLVEECEDYEKFKQFMLKMIDILKIGENCRDEIELIEFSKIKLPTKPSFSKSDDDVYLAELNKKAEFLKTEVKNMLAKISVFFSETKEVEKFRCEQLYPVYDAMVALVEKYMDYYQQEKREENAVDYDDLEHLTLKLLKNESIRKEISDRYKYIFTDEYQDTSGVQEAILKAISHDNLFMVGDVKQCIYHFRGCNPEIFADKYEKFQHGEGGTAISLDKNFRSTAEIIDCVNRVFSNIMTKEAGKIDYKKSPMEAGAPYPDRGDAPILYSVKKNQVENKLPLGIYSIINHLGILNNSKEFAEGKQAVYIINSIVGKDYFSLKDNCYKKIGYGDIVILLRSVKNECDLYANELIKAGIPVSASSQRSIGEYAEVRFAINILELIDCYNQDIPLASVLKSPIGKLKESDFLTIRRAYPSGTFVGAVSKYQEEKNDEIAEKLNNFSKYFEKLRLLAEFVPCDKLLSDIIRENAIDLKILSSPMGELKMARLNRFIQCAGTKKEMVHEFLMGIDEALEKVTMNFTDDNAVQIMTIHNSKGLEFPVVIMGEIYKQFADLDKKKDYAIDRDLGLALHYKDKVSRVLRKTLFFKYVAEKNLRQEREEEMRLFYVAMTRAKNYLFLISQYSNDKNAGLRPIHGISDVHNCINFYGMLADDDINSEKGGNFEEIGLSQKERRQVLAGETDEYTMAEIEKNLNFEYPYKDSANLAVKRSVTDVAHFEETETPRYEVASIFGNSDNETGTAYHRLLELCDFYKPAESEFNRVIGGLMMEDEQKKLIEKEKIQRIFAMPVFEKLKGFTLYKEQPFTCYMPAELIDENYHGEGEVLIQGVIDLLAIKGDEAIIVDYKHSKIKEDKDLIERYKKQLELYAFATEKVLGKKVIGTYLANIYSARTVEVEF